MTLEKSNKVDSRTTSATQDSTILPASELNHKNNHLRRSKSKLNIIPQCASVIADLLVKHVYPAKMSTRLQGRWEMDSRDSYWSWDGCVKKVARLSR
jgi:hypothetical protein